MRARDCLPESRALTSNADNDGISDYVDLKSEHTEYVIFNCFINLHVDTIEYAKSVDCIIEIFDNEDEQIRILNLTDNDWKHWMAAKMWVLMTIPIVRVAMKIYYFQDYNINMLAKHSTENQNESIIN